MTTAYLLAFVDTTQSPPALMGAGIYSSDAGSITTDLRRRFAVEITHTRGESYGEAADAIRVLVNGDPMLAWVKSLMRGEA